MKLLYSNILPLSVGDEEETIIDAFNSQAEKADRIDIAVGYVSRAALDELNELIEKNGISEISLNIGMYYIEGMPEGSYHTALRLNEKWQESGKGEIRLIKTFKYHGKVYVFYKNGIPFSAIIGSANLGVLKLEANNRRQYELSAITDSEQEVLEIAEHVNKLKAANISANIKDIVDVPLIQETNTALSGIDLVTEVPTTNVEFYKRCASYASFLLPLKVPSYNERHMDDGKHYTKFYNSN